MNQKESKQCLKYQQVENIQGLENESLRQVFSFISKVVSEKNQGFNTWFLIETHTLVLDSEQNNCRKLDFDVSMF